MAWAEEQTDAAGQAKSTVEAEEPTAADTQVQNAKMRSLSIAAPFFAIMRTLFSAQAQFRAAQVASRQPRRHHQSESTT